MTRLSFLRGAALAAVVGTSVLCMAGCGDRRANVTGPGQGSFRIQLRGAVTGTSADAFARVDAAHVVVTQTAAILLDTSVAFAGASGGNVTLLVQPRDPSGSVAVALDLLRGGQALFRGNGSTLLQRGKTTSLTLSVTPVVSSVTGPDSVLLTAIGDTVRLSATGLFATGDTVSGTPLSWTADGASVIRVSPDGVVTAVGEGLATATATYQGVSHATRGRVQAVVTRVTLSPDSFFLSVGQSQTVTAVARDRNGNVLQRTFTWRSLDPTVATAGANGVVTGVRSGSATIMATVGGVSGTAIVQVGQPIVAVSPNLLSFPVTVGSAGATQTAFVTNAGTGTLSGLTSSISYGAGASGWLSATLASGTAPTALTLTVNPGQLPVGSYTATVTVGSSLPGAGTAQVSVTMLVQPLQPLVGVSNSTVTMYMAYDSTFGYSARDSSITVFNAGTGTLSALWVSVSSSVEGCYLQGWLTAGLGSDTAPTRLMLTAQGYAYGSCYATVTIGSTLPGTGTKTVGVTYIGSSVGAASVPRAIRP